MNKYAIFTTDGIIRGIAASDLFKNKFVEMDNTVTSISISDEQFDKIRRNLASATYDGINLNYFTHSPERIVISSENLGGYLEDKIKRIYYFNIHNSNDITKAYEQKLRDLLLMYKVVNIKEFTDILNSKTFENWYFNQENFPDFSDLEIY